MQDKEQDSKNKINSSLDFNLDDLDSLENTIKSLETDMSAIKGSAKAKKDDKEAEEYFIGNAVNKNLTGDDLRENFIDIDMALYSVLPGQLLYCPAYEEKKYKAGSYAFPGDDGRIFSKKEGIYSVDENNVINISPLKQTKGSVKPSSQTHHINESLVVNGKIENNASIEVAGDLIVLGTIGNAHVKAGGNLFAKGGIVGHDAKNKIIAQNIFTKYIESSTVEAYDNIVVNEEILNSKIWAGQNIYALGKKALILGGETVAGYEINCKNLGNEKGVVTTVAVGLKSEGDKKIKEYGAKIEELSKILSDTDKTLGYILKEKAEKGISPEKEKSAADLKQKKENLSSEIKFINDKILELNDDLAQKKEAKICVEDTAYPGVKMGVKNSDIYPVKKSQKKAAFIEKRGKIITDVYTEPHLEKISRKIKAVKETGETDTGKLRKNIIIESKTESFALIFAARFLKISKDSLFAVKLSENKKSGAAIYRIITFKKGEDIKKIKKFYEPKELLTKVRITCETLEEGMSQAVKNLNSPKEQIDYKIIQEKAKGLMGIGEKPYIIDFSLKAFAEDTTQVKKHSKESLAALTKDSDGYFVITNDDDGLKITVYPSKGEGTAVEYNEIKKYLDEKKFKKQIDYKLIPEIIERSEAVPETIGPRQPQPEIDGRFDIDIEDGKTKCFVEVRKALTGGKEINFEDVYNSLAEKGIKDIKEDKLKEIFDKGYYGKRTLIAEGVPPVVGQDAYYEFKVRVDESELKIKQDGEGKVDFHELDKIENVTQGQVLAVKHTASDGKSGMDIFGNEIISNKGKDTTIIAGKNTEIDDDGVTIKSILDGQVLLMGKLLKVEPIYTVGKDVDYETGNINFLGSVMVRGAVRDGFSVRASGDIYVNNVEKAYLEAEGNIYIKSGMQGRDEGEVHAGGDITAKFLENAKVYAGKNVIVQEAILHSDISAGSIVQVKSGKRGWIVGTHVRAKDGVDVKELGSKVGTKTTVEVGLDPMLRHKSKELEEELKTNIEGFQKIKGALKKLIELKETLGKLPENKEDLFQQLVTAGKNMDKRVKEIDADLKNIEEELNQTTSAVVSVFAKVWPGVKITIKNANLFIDKEIQHLSFVYEAGEVSQKTYKELKLKKTGDENSSAPPKK